MEDSALGNRADAGKIGITHVSFVCQNCSQPLKLHQSFESIERDERTYADLVAPILPASSLLSNGLSTTVNQNSDSSPLCRTVSPVKLFPTDSGNDFTLLGESEPAMVENLSRQLRVTAELFDVLSGQCEVDHPLCEECTDNLLDLLDHQLRITEDECKDYNNFLDTLEDAEAVNSETSVDDEIINLKEEEATLKQQLDSIENERTQIGELMKREQEKSIKLDREEQKYFREYNEYKRQLFEYEDAQRSVDNQLKYAKSQLDKLTKTNVFNATFHIWYSGHFGTINNFRLGRLPNVPVEWNEINAAWGQTVLLLHSLANKMNLKFERYRLVPYGNHSYVKVLGDRKELPLYGSGGIKFFWDTKFDQAMVAFLDCLQQFKEAVEKGDTAFSLPYKMEKGKIEESGGNGSSYSIKTQFNSEEQWTKALKFMLTNLKWGLAWVSTQFGNK